MYQEWEIVSPSLWPKRPDDEPSPLDLIPDNERERLIVLQACDGDPRLARELFDEWDAVEVHRHRLLKLAAIWRPPK